MGQERIIIYIRHGEDIRDGYKYDEKLTDDGKYEVKVLANKLIKDYGVPEVIYYSPYYRTRQTTRIMLKVIHEELNEKIRLKCDPRLSRFFTKRQKRDPDISRSTRKKGAPIYESWSDFKYRAEEQISDMEENDKYQIIWCVTHTLILDRLINIKNIDHGFKIPYLDTIVLRV